MNKQRLINIILMLVVFFGGYGFIHSGKASKEPTIIVSPNIPVPPNNLSLRIDLQKDFISLNSDYGSTVKADVIHPEIIKEVYIPQVINHIIVDTCYIPIPTPFNAFRKALEPQVLAKTPISIEETHKEFPSQFSK